MSKEMYKTVIHFSNDSLIKVIRLCGMLLGFKGPTDRELMPFTAEESHINAYLLLLRSSQAHFPPMLDKDAMHHKQVVGTRFGVQYIRHRFLEATDTTALYSQLFPILGRDLQLIDLLSKLCHVTDSGVHRSIICSQGEFMKGFYSCYYTGFQKKSKACNTQMLCMQTNHEADIQTAV